jgi:hypothetical protein
MLLNVARRLLSPYYLNPCGLIFIHPASPNTMPISSSASKRPVEPNVLRKAVVRASETMSAHLPSSSPSESPQAALRRQNTTTVNRLLSSTIDWLAALPPNVRPLALATKYPRLANRIAQEWREPSACRRDFDDLVYDKRGTRRGFPPDVYVELLALRDYYYGYDLALAKEA